MFLDNFPKVLWINLDSSTERRNYMENLLNSYNIENIRISAINGVDSNSHDLDICIKNPQLTNAENACSCSHLVALRYFIENTEEDKIVIFEDDVSFDFLEYIPFNWSDFIEKLPQNYKIIQLAIIGMNFTIPTKLVEINKSYWSSCAYLITRKAAIEILNEYYPNFKKIKLNNRMRCNAVADGIIKYCNNSYSIPIFSYMTVESLIHQEHVNYHKKSKNQQFEEWKKIKNMKKEEAISSLLSFKNVPKIST
jgi:GR25 family glycosyltransferase involved in LPS biosynthesis